MAAMAPCWVGLLRVGGLVGGSHCQLPLLVIQRPAASPSPPMMWHLENLDPALLGAGQNRQLFTLKDGEGGPSVHWCGVGWFWLLETLSLIVPRC